MVENRALIGVALTTRPTSRQELREADQGISGPLKALLHSAIFLATCLAVLLLQIPVRVIYALFSLPVCFARYF